MNAITPYLCCKNAAAAIDFYKKAFGATEEYRLAEPDGRVGHAELCINGALFMLADEYPDMGVLSPQSIGGSAVGIHLYVDDADAVAAKAAEAGATILRPVTDQFYGDRSGTIQDPFGHRWFVSTKKETLDGDEIKRRYDELLRKGTYK
jgi:PhnB protein